MRDKFRRVVLAIRNGAINIIWMYQRLPEPGLFPFFYRIPQHSFSITRGIDKLEGGRIRFPTDDVAVFDDTLVDRVSRHAFESHQYLSKKKGIASIAMPFSITMQVWL